MVKIRLLRRMERIEDVMEKETVSDTQETEGNTNQNNTNNTNVISEVSKNGICSEVKENGHISSDDSLSPEVEIVENGEVDVAASGAAAAANSPPSIVTCHSITNNGPVTNQSTSPNSFSPNSKPPRGSSPQNCSNHNSAANQQHVVHVHISQGETFSVRVGEQIQRIQGPATVRMVSNNGPPLPMPMQVAPGHMVQQIVDEHGILTHVFLSAQPTSMPVGGPSMTGGPNNTPPHAQYYQGYGPPYPAHHYPHHHPTTHHGASPHVHTGAPTHPHGTPTPPSCNNPSGPVHTGPSQPNSMEGRANKQRERARRKFEERRNQGYYPPQPRPRINGKQKETHAKPVPYEYQQYQGNGMNGDSLPPGDTGQTELAEERKVIQQVLSGTPDPVVSEIEARSALIQLALPEWDPNEFDIDPADFRFTLLLSDKGKEGKYKLVYSGDATEITLKDLKPAIDYHLRVYTSLEDIKGNTTEPVKFTTSACEPDPPSPPKLNNKNKTSITLKWNSTCENGAKISTYTLEMDKGNGEYVEVYNGLQRQTRINKLQVSTKYTFRLAAINSIGKSEYSEPASFYTSGSVPSQPDPPMLSEPFTTSLIISWIKHPNEDLFQLQMDDESTGHGFIVVYNGPDLSYKVKNLLRNTEYKFRLAALNDEGQSKWSEVVAYRTKPDRPAPPPKPQIKGKIHAYNFRVVWEPPKDNGGAEITKYIVEIDDGRGSGGYETLYEGSEREHVCDRLTPGQMYMVRVACCNVAGRSEFSEPCGATTQAVVPGQCQVPKLQGKPKATSLHLRWANPEYDGGATVSEFAVQMVTPDNACREVYKGRDLDCIVAGLSPGRPYLFQVRAFNRVGGGGWSDPFEVVSGAGVPDPPKAPHVACKSAYSALVSWEPPVNNGATITDYRLEWQQKTEVTDFAMLYTGPNQSYEIKGLTPATLYLFRVQAINSAGQGPYSPVASCVTPPSSPSSVTIHRHTATATSITLFWKEPNSNGNDITAYNLEVGDKQFTIGAVTEYTIETLQPETPHKIRIQAVNSIGVGPFSAPVRVTTRPLPPNPSKLECIAPAPNSLKLKWGDQRGLDTNHYTLEMEKEDGNFQVIYEGSSHFFKVNKLQETTNYNFRIYASNDVGSGPYSEIYTFSTTKAPPPAVRAPRVSNLSQQTCSIEWQPCKAIQGSSLEYILQLQGEQEYQKIYRGEDTCFQVENLSPKSDYHLRVCAIRICEDGSEVVGAFSPVVSFTTQGHEPVSPQEADVKQESKLVESKPLTDQQWAMIILMGFVVFAVLVAIIAQQIIKYRSSSIPR
eukprot:XP_011435920.1 PREDICTED: fibronectin type-III domain-containing protein 3A isoform X3 [Crassostrea gigas]